MHKVVCQISLLMSELLLNCDLQHCKMQWNNILLAGLDFDQMIRALLSAALALRVSVLRVQDWLSGQVSVRSFVSWALHQAHLAFFR